MAPSTAGWIDIHAHFLPPQSAAEARERFLSYHARCFLLPEHSLPWSPEPVISYLDAAGIAMQMLSFVPKTVDGVRASNDYAAGVVKQFPHRFGLLAALPTNDAAACLAEIERARGPELNADGFAVTCLYHGVYLSDPSLGRVWARLDELKAVVFMHPDAAQDAHLGRPAPVIEVAFETTRTLVDMLYRGVFRRYPNITWIASHGGGALPLLADRLELLGTEPWVPNPEGITKAEVKRSLSRLYIDTAAVGCSSLCTALRLVGKTHIVYGSDCGVPCSTTDTMEENKRNILAYEGLSEDERSEIGRNVHRLFPEAVKRMQK